MNVNNIIALIHKNTSLKVTERIGLEPYNLPRLQECSGKYASAIRKEVNKFKPIADANNIKIVVEDVPSKDVTFLLLYEI